MWFKKGQFQVTLNLFKLLLDMEHIAMARRLYRRTLEDRLAEGERTGLIFWRWRRPLEAIALKKGQPFTLLEGSESVTRFSTTLL